MSQQVPSKIPNGTGKLQDSLFDSKPHHRSSGLRIVCFYEDEVERVRDLVSGEFEVIEITDKTAQMHETDNAFGYKGLHMDLRLTEAGAE
ncbi:hypothetical protein PV773_06950 [Mesorhizobium sp. CC13]